MQQIFRTFFGAKNLNRAAGILTILLLGAEIVRGGEVSAGDEIERVETKLGRVYEKVKVREVTADGLKIIHSSGTATIPAVDVPQFAAAFAKAKAKQAAASELPVTPPPAPAEPAKPAWLPTSPAEVAGCSLFVNVTKGIGPNGVEASWAGTAFLCNHGGVTYIYTNAHVFNGAVEFSITDKKHVRYDDFVSVETAADGSGYWKQTGLGGDIVRIRLANFREKALSMDPVPLTSENAKGRKILVTGNTGGLGAITQLQGTITDIAEDHIIRHNAATEQGNSGSPIVDLSTYQVVGILTWGGRLPEPLQVIWVKQSEETREGFKSGAALATIRYVPTTFDILKRQQVVLNQLMKNVRLFGLLDTLIPAKQGLFVDKTAIVMGDYTVGDLLAESADHPVVAELLGLDRFLRSKASGNIGINNQDMLKKYIATYSRCLAMISSQRSALENTQAATFYMKCHLKQTRLIEICKAYEALSRRTLAWYVAQQGAGGQSLPVADRFRLPVMRTGLNGLGIKEN